MINELPFGWERVELKELGQLMTGNTPSKKRMEYYSNGEIEFIKPGDIQDSLITTYSEKLSETARKAARIIRKGGILVTCIGNLGRVGYTNKEIAFNQQINAIVPNEKISSNFLFYRLQPEKKQLEKLASATTVRIVNKSKFGKLIITYPKSKEEQILIVAEIEKQFTRLDAGVKSLKEIKRKLEVYRKSVLEAAFNGNLTEAHIKEKIKLKQLITDIRYGTSKKCGLDSSKIPVLRIPNVVKGVIDLSNLKYADLSNQEFGNLELKSEDILVIRSNGSKSLVGRSAILPDNFNGYCFAGYLIRIRLDKRRSLPKYLNYFFQSGVLRNQIEFKAKSTSGVHNINSKELGELDINLFDLNHQEQIISEIESRFSVINKIEETIDVALIKSEQLRKSILKSAFEGKLVKFENKEK